MKLGAGITFNTKIEENLKILLEAGYKYLFFDAHFVNKSEREIKKITKIVHTYSLQPFTIHGFQLVPELNEEIKTILPHHFENLEKYSILGVKYITYHFGWCKGLKEGDDFNFENVLRRYNIKLEDYRKKNIEVLKILCWKAKSYGLSLTIENLPIGCLADLGTTVDDLLKIIKEVDETNLGICFDSGHAFISSLNLYQEILKARKYLFETHFHDNLGRISNKNEINDLHQPIGIGRINWLEVISALKKINFKNPVVFEIGCDKNTLGINKCNWERFLKLYKEKFSNQAIWAEPVLEK